MIIYMGDELASAVTSHSLVAAEIAALEDIASVVRSGQHLVIGGYDTLKAIGGLAKLGTSARAAFSSVLSRFSQLQSALDRVDIYAEVILGNGVPLSVKIDGKIVIKIPLLFILDMNLRSPVEILFEEINDRFIYEIISRWYVERVFGAGLLNRSYRSVHGGGGRTFAVFTEMQRENSSFLVCVTDSDRKFPSDVFGITSTKVRDVNDQGKVLSFHLDLDFHEVENLVPLSFIKENSNSKYTDILLAQMKKAELNGCPEAKLFLDYKKGIKYCYLRSEEKALAYWGMALSLEGLACQKRCELKDCACEVVKPLQNKAEIRNKIESLTPISPNECPILEKLWSDIGSVLISWSASAVPKLA